MRFDDMLSTLLAQPNDDEPAKIALWRQLVDLLAQGRFTDDEALSDDALDYIVALRGGVSAAVKAETAKALTGRPINIAAVALFADEPPAIIAPIIAEARLETQEWLTLLPILTPTARALIRHRRDLASEVVRALDSFGHSDFVIAGVNQAGQGVMVAEGNPAGPADAFAVQDVDAAGQQVENAEWTPEPSLSLGALKFGSFAGTETHEPEAVAAVAEALSDVDPYIELDTPAPAASGETQIRDLMARIEAYRLDDFIRPADFASVGENAHANADEDGFQFETGADGTICWVAGVQRGRVIGETIAIAAHGSDHGVDGYVAGAFRQRAPFRDARLTLGGEDGLSGEWRISAVPVFEQVDGRFSGYRGTARRPRLDEIAAPSMATGVFGDNTTSDSLRQLVHELRTPLNAILGFSEMIEGQMLGPASTAYREKATDIRAQGHRLLTALEDLDTSARMDTASPEVAAIDPAELLQKLHGEYQDIAIERGYRLKFRVATDLGLVAADPIAVERMFARLLSGTLAVAGNGETIAVVLDHDPDSRDRMCLAIDRPKVLSGRDERMLLDPGYNPDGDWPEAPILGLGFALRLVRNIATASSGALDIQSDKLILRLPLRKISARSRKG